MAELTRKRIGRKRLRQLFNDGNFWERAQKGEFLQIIDKQSHLDPSKTTEPPCTHSQMVDYVDDNGVEVARVHQYRRPDNSLGGSGRPDPKKLRIGNIIFTI